MPKRSRKSESLRSAWTRCGASSSAVAPTTRCASTGRRPARWPSTSSPPWRRRRLPPRLLPRGPPRAPSRASPARYSGSRPREEAPPPRAMLRRGASSLPQRHGLRPRPSPARPPRPSWAAGRPRRRLAACCPASRRRPPSRHVAAPRRPSSRRSAGRRRALARWRWRPGPCCCRPRTLCWGSCAAASGRSAGPSTSAPSARPETPSS
mmetsp:Transcript_36562/g.113995  ORF Transcript_36562/g.113995 Transcript_36562/m.113995 type:complete len:208 (+) Transcript_36562:1676-2299(+)